MLSLVLLSACSTSKPSDEDSSVFVPSIDSEIPTSDLNGIVPENALALPQFTATNYDGSSRTAEDLIGNPTVLWFYPAADTAG